MGCSSTTTKCNRTIIVQYRLVQYLYAVQGSIVLAISVCYVVYLVSQSICFSSRYSTVLYLYRILSTVLIFLLFSVQCNFTVNNFEINAFINKIVLFGNNII